MSCALHPRWVHGNDCKQCVIDGLTAQLAEASQRIEALQAELKEHKDQAARGGKSGSAQADLPHRNAGDSSTPVPEKAVALSQLLADYERAADADAEWFWVDEVKKRIAR